MPDIRGRRTEAGTPGKFRVEVGIHLDKGPPGCTCDGCTNPSGMNHIYRAYSDRGDPRRGIPPDTPDYTGDIVESEVDLVQRFNSPGSIKFSRVVEAPVSVPQGPITDEEIRRRGLTAEAAVERAVHDLNTMPEDELRALAEASGVDLKGAKAREDMVRLIKDSL